MPQVNEVSWIYCCSIYLAVILSLFFLMNSYFNWSTKSFNTIGVYFFSFSM